MTGHSTATTSWLRKSRRMKGPRILLPGRSHLRGQPGGHPDRLRGRGVLDFLVTLTLRQGSGW